MKIINMPFGEKVKCSLCEKGESVMWHQSDKGVLCNECQEEVTSTKSIPETCEDQEDEIKLKKPIKSIRNCKTRQNSASSSKQITNKIKSRRSGVFKRNFPYKSPTSRATIVTFQNCFHKGELYSVGDIVWVRGVDGGVYYAQITGLMQDEYCEKSCTITWLIPTINPTMCQQGKFDPMFYVLGPAEDLPRKLDCFNFVMHCPGDYWRVTSPFPSRSPAPSDNDFVWTRLHGSN